MKRQVICLMGPTASGKTDLALALSDALPISLISVDSAMVYRGLDIGTAKPTPDVLARYPHALVDLLDPAESYSAGQFCTDAVAAIEQAFAQDKIPLLVGGTMLYFNLLQRGFSEFPASDPVIRTKVQAELEEEGLAALYARLESLDAVTATQVKPTDRQRITRALEVFYATGMTLSEWQAQQEWHEHPFEFINVILLPPVRTELHARIEHRLDAMLAQGLVQEVRRLYERGDLSPDLPALRMVGYRQVWEYLTGVIDYQTMRDKILFATRQLAKRQITWLQQWKTRAVFFDPLEPDAHAQALAHIKKLLFKSNT